MATNTDSTSTTIPKNNLPTPNRYITSYDPSTLLSIFTPSIPESHASYTTANSNMVVHDSYRTLSNPPPLTNEVDLTQLESHLPIPSSPDPSRQLPNINRIWFPALDQTLLRHCDFPPNSTLPMHRTETVDLGVCVSGSMELTLDSGEKRVMNVGDVIVQRGTMHAWRNPSETEWARVVFFLVGAEPVVVGGRPMREEVEWPTEE